MGARLRSLAVVRNPDFGQGIDERHFADRTRLVRIWTGDIEIHISADIAYAIWQYWQATGDDDFMLNRGAEVIKARGASSAASAACQALENSGAAGIV